MTHSPVPTRSLRFILHAALALSAVVHAFVLGLSFEVRVDRGRVTVATRIVAAAVDPVMRGYDIVAVEGDVPSLAAAVVPIVPAIVPLRVQAMRGSANGTPRSATRRARLAGSPSGRGRDPTIIAHVVTGIIRSDRWFTLPGVLGIIIAGVAAAMVGGFPILGTGWILWSIVLFTVSGLAFGLRVAPLQRRMAALALGATGDRPFDWSHYHRLSRQWEIWGLLALLAPVIALGLMVLKPQLPAL